MIRNISLRNFRNIEDIKVPFSKNINILVGQNGQGKTNLLEALNINLTGQSFRYADNLSLIKKGKSESYLKAEAICNNLNFEIETRIQKTVKSYSLNKKKVLLRELNKRFPQIIFSPESLLIIKESSEQRRALVDELVANVHERYIDLIYDFRKALKTRNRIFKDFQNGIASKNQTLLLIESINPLFLRLSTELTFTRINCLKGVLPFVNQAMKSIQNKSNVDIFVEYVISNQNSIEKSQEELAEMLSKRANQLIDAELSSGVSLVGPQKHDINFLYNGNNSRFFCSQGQQRALILAFKMAQIVYHRELHGTYPVLLLDDVLSELDQEKRDSLIQFLGELKAQIFISTTDFSLPEFMKSDDCVVFNVREGLIG